MCRTSILRDSIQDGRASLENSALFYFSRCQDSHLKSGSVFCATSSQKGCRDRTHRPQLPTAAYVAETSSRNQDPGRLQKEVSSNPRLLLQDRNHISNPGRGIPCRRRTEN